MAVSAGASIAGSLIRSIIGCARLQPYPFRCCLEIPRLPNSCNIFAQRIARCRYNVNLLYCNTLLINHIPTQ